MKILFLGVGDAFDETVPNTSIWLETGAPEPCGVLLECGPTVPPSYWTWIRHAGRVDLIWISHFHADHFFGLPALLYSFHFAHRTKPLGICGPEGMETTVRDVVDLAFPGLYGALSFPIRLMPVEAGGSLHFRGMTWSFVELPHGQRNLAVRIESRGKSLYYSGDGMPTAQALDLARGCDLIIHEAFRLDEGLPAYGHATMVQAVDFARRAGVPALALVHVEWTLRHRHRQDIAQLIEAGEALRIWLPEPGENLTL